MRRPMQFSRRTRRRCRRGVRSTVLSSATPSSIGTRTTSVPLQRDHLRRSRPRARRRSPRRRSASRSRGRTRSGVPPRSTWPSCVMRASNPVRCSISSLQPVADAAEADVAELVDLARLQLHRARDRRRALGDDDDREVRAARVAVRRAARRPPRCRTASRERGSRRRRRRARSTSRSSPRGGPSPRRPSRGRGSRPSCAAGRSRRSRSAPRCGSRT